jgi:alkylation response protein AidB-like acyl-CoA dehydrogenase
MTKQHFSQLDAILESLQLEFAARAAKHDREASFPFENLTRLHEFGLLAVTVPRRFGGGIPSYPAGGGTCDATLTASAKIISMIARGDPSTALVLTMQYLFQRIVAQSPTWPDHLRERIHKDAVRDGALVNALRVEPELGTPARGGLPATLARRTEKGWLLSGRKLYSTGIPALTWLAVWGRSDETEPRVGFFLIHRNTPGTKIIENWDHLGMRASGSHEVVFEDVFIPSDHAVDLRSPADWALGFEADQVAWMTVLLGSLYDGIARSARDWLLDFLRTRAPANLGASLSTLPRFQEAVGTIEALLLTNDCLLREAAENCDRGTPQAAHHANLVKYIVTKNAIDVVAKAVELTGNPGLSRANPLERHYRDVLCSRVHTPQNDVILINAGRQTFASLSTEGVY